MTDKPETVMFTADVDLNVTFFIGTPWRTAVALDATKGIPLPAGGIFTIPAAVANEFEENWARSIPGLRRV